MTNSPSGIERSTSRSASVGPLFPLNVFPTPMSCMAATLTRTRRSRPGVGPLPAPRVQDGRPPNWSGGNLSAEVQSTAQRRSPPPSRWRFHLGGGTSSRGSSAGRRNTVHLGDNRIIVAYIRMAGSTDGVGVGGRRSADSPRPPPLRVFAAPFAERASVRDAGLLIVNLFGRPLSPR